MNTYVCFLTTRSCCNRLGFLRRRRESSLRKENQKLLNTVEEYKRKHEQLSEEMLNSTKPIVKQLENEINKNNAATVLWEKQERDYLATISKT